MRERWDGVHGMVGLKPRNGVRPALRAVMVFLVCTFALAAANAASPQPVSQATRAAERILEEGDYQRELPKAPAIPHWSLRLPDEFASVARILLWIVAAVAIVLLVQFLRQEFGRDLKPDVLTPEKRNRSRRSALPTTGTPRIDGAAARDLLREADELAAQGAFAEAIHLILLRGIEDVRTSIAEGLRPSLTTREIVDRTGLDERMTEAFRFIASAAELCHFGGRAANGQLYGQCRDVYARLAFGEEPSR